MADRKVLPRGDGIATEEELEQAAREREWERGEEKKDQDHRWLIRKNSIKHFLRLIFSIGAIAALFVFGIWYAILIFQRPASPDLPIVQEWFVRIVVLVMGGGLERYLDDGSMVAGGQAQSASK